MMKITFQCSSCQQIMRVREENAGRKARCIKCGTILNIPERSLEHEGDTSDTRQESQMVARTPNRRPRDDNEERTQRTKAEREPDELEELEERPARRKKGKTRAADDERSVRKKKAKKSALLPWLLAGIGLVAAAGISVLFFVGIPGGTGASRIALEGKSDEFLQMLFPEAKVRQAVLVSAVKPADEAVKIIFNRYDLISGKKLDGMVISAGLNYFGPGQASLSPDGSRILSFWVHKIIELSLTDGTETIHELPPLTRLSFAAFLDSQRILIVYAGGHRCCWQMPGKQELYNVSGQTPPLGRQAGGQQPGHMALSPDRAVAAVYVNGYYEFFDTATGKSRGVTAPTDASIAAVRNTAFSPDGKQLACYCSVVQGTVAAEAVLRWEVSTGKATGRMTVPRKFDGFRWLDWVTPKIVVLLSRPQQWVTNRATKATVLDLERGEIIEERDAFPGVFGFGSGDGCLWCATGNPPVLTRIDLSARGK